MDEVLGARDRRHVRGHLLLGRPDVRLVLVLAGRSLDAPVLLHRDRRAVGLLAAVLLAQARRREKWCRQGTGGAGRRARRGRRPVRAAASVAVGAPDAEGPFERILLASEGRAIPDAAVTRVIELASRAG